MGAFVSLAVGGIAHQGPDDVGPPFPIARRVRIPRLVGELMMDSVRRDPGDRTAFESQRAADGQKVLDPFRRLERTMCQQPVVSHSDAEAQRNPVESKRRKEGMPAKEEKSNGCPSVEYAERSH